MCNTENITYEIMDYNGNTEFTSKGYEQIESKHTHKIINVTIKEHKNIMMVLVQLHTTKGKNV